MEARGAGRLREQNDGCKKHSRFSHPSLWLMSRMHF
jgi:hypothetical protein